MIETDNRTIADTTSKLYGIVLHILIQKQERCGEMKNGIEVDGFKEICSSAIKELNGVIFNVSTNAIIGVFHNDTDSETPEIRAARCAHDLRQKLIELRKDGWQIVMKACINGGDVIIGTSIGENEYEMLGSGINASFQILDTTHHMQISLTRKVREQVSEHYNCIARRPVDIGPKSALLFYLHTPADERFASEDAL